MSYASTSSIFMGDVYLDHIFAAYNGDAAHSLLPPGSTTFVNGQFVWQNTDFPYVSFPSFCWAFALVCLLQAVMTLSLHAAELLVNVTRDEQMWRRAGGRGLSRVSTNALHAMLVSSPALVLLVLKPILHWMFGLSVSTYFSVGLVMQPPQIFYLTIGATCLALFVSACTFWRPRGPQPATFGHLQTLVDLIDEWPEIGETMFWGRKDSPGVEVTRMETDASQGDVAVGREKIIAHAGTSAVKLEDVKFEEVYLGTNG